MQGIVPILGIEADFDIVFGPAVACEDFVYPVASVNLIWPLLIFSFGPTLW